MTERRANGSPLTHLWHIWFRTNDGPPPVSSSVLAQTAHGPLTERLSGVRPCPSRSCGVPPDAPLAAQELLLLVVSCRTDREPPRSDLDRGGSVVCHLAAGAPARPPWTGPGPALRLLPPQGRGKYPHADLRARGPNHSPAFTAVGTAVVARPGAWLGAVACLPATSGGLGCWLPPGGLLPPSSLLQ